MIPLSPAFAEGLLLIAVVLGALMLKRVLFQVGIRLAHWIAERPDNHP